ncbi:MAG: hypothetical protein L3J24_07770 [Xanthomonadales bacterium]|nr:hypothetical protein [Xanthomonadales bacterium]
MTKALSHTRYKGQQYDFKEGFRDPWNAGETLFVDLATKILEVSIHLE